MGKTGRRYPWGDAGAVCRRVAHGLAEGPCARGATGPQLAGSHPSGASPEGIHDLAGNVAEWARIEGGYQVRGGSWADASVTSLRSFSARDVDGSRRADTIGFRCVYP
jgi:formylglycine-generating enzyme required for sulfatase activity